jgi:hypothetical protein
MIEYARVAGGRLAARLVDNGAAALAGIVTLVPRDDEAVKRIEEVLAIFNSRVGTAWLGTLTSGLNFNPGYAAEVPLGRHDPPEELNDLVRRLVATKADLARRDPTADTFVDTRAPWEECELTSQMVELEAALDRVLCRHLGLHPEVYASIPPVRRSRPRGTATDDYLMVRVLRLLRFRWPGERASARPAQMSVPSLAAALADALRQDGAHGIDVDLDGWIRHRLPRYQESRFRRRPVVLIDAGVIRLTDPSPAVASRPGLSN